jgi:hypothetical protein
MYRVFEDQIPYPQYFKKPGSVLGKRIEVAKEPDIGRNGTRIDNGQRFFE